MINLALIGRGIALSRSPHIHTHWMKMYGIKGTYTLVDVEALTDVPFTYDGVNVTMPYKEAILPYCESLSAEASAIGAVNTLVGRKGYNTDGLGVKSLITGPYKKAVIVGTGGAAKAIHWALKDQASEIIHLSRGISLDNWKTHIEGADFLANASPMGMIGYPEIINDLSGLASDATVMEMVYGRKTQLLTLARDLKVIDGMALLIAQAKFSFHLWTGILPEDDGMLKGVLVA